MKTNPWSRFDRIHEYCDVCCHKSSCSEWCFGNRFKQSEVTIIKQGLISRLLNWLLSKKENKT